MDVVPLAKGRTAIWPAARSGRGRKLGRWFLSEYVKAMKYMHDPDDDEISELLLDVVLAQLWGKCKAPDFSMSLTDPAEQLI